MILCGGLGSRLHEETEFRPKPMLEIGGRPILWHIMKLYSAHGFKEFILCLGYKGHLIKDFFLKFKAYESDFTIQLGDSERIEYHDRANGEDWRVTLVETGQAAQTGARVARAARYVRTGTFLLTYGDGLGDIDLKALLKFHQSHGRICTVTGVRPPGRFGELEMDGKGSAVQFNEKPQVAGGIINGGFFVFQREFLDRYLEERDDLVLEQGPLQRLAREGQMMVYSHGGFWQPMDTYREFKLLNELWGSGKAPWKKW
ncbi:MAG: glucose-1-phosphate cytidylyltransferase [Candidatus Omnitrophica bacterium]|nr:glucose-1-phosphate cytidylyltransferase [Candidatus Omnitrophota bacterium]